MCCGRRSAGTALLPVLQNGNSFLRLLYLLLGSLAICCALTASAQQPPIPGNPVTLQNAPQRDTTNRSSTANWRDEPVSIHASPAFSALRTYPDTQLHHFHRRPFLQPWYRDLGNLGSPARSQLFIPENLGHTGPSLGYRVYDIYRLIADSLPYYNTTRPYTVFNYQLGSKLEQTLRLMHTQNVTPRWNVAARYQKIGSPGFYRLQRTNHDAGALNTQYSSVNQQYELYGAVVYNNMQSDENGGILGDSLLEDPIYGDRQTIPVALENRSYYASSSAGRRSSITNTLRDFNILIRHQYTLGRRDTLYNEDSTQYRIQLVPRFSIRHRLEGGSERHKSKDVAPDSLVYLSFFNRSFASADSVSSVQQRAWVDNRVSLNGFVGPKERQLALSAGIGNRLDNFYTDFIADREKSSIISTYLTGDLTKEALSPEAWGYAAHAKFFIAGAAVGNFLISGTASKDFGRTIGAVRAGASQQLTDAPYAYTVFRNQYFRQEASLSKESITLLWAELSNERLGVSASFRNYVIGNYVYLRDSLEGVSNGKLAFAQHAGPFNLTQLSLRKAFHMRNFVLDNEVSFQQKTGDAPVSVPLLLGRHSLGIESYLFKRALKVATGAEVRYHSDYNAEGYSPFYNRFYYQSDYTTSNKPELSAFFNFKIKRFRAYLMVDQLQALFWRNTVIHPGYASQNMMLRFGFEWVLVN